MRISTFALLGALGLGALGTAQGCGSSSDSAFSGSSGSTGDGGPGSSGGTSGSLGGGDGGPNGSSGGTAQAIIIDPPEANLDVTITDGVVAAPPSTAFHTQYADSHTEVDGASWTIDKGELGAIVTATGVFTASGVTAGTATVTATLNGQLASSR